MIALAPRLIQAAAGGVSSVAFAGHFTGASAKSTMSNSGSRVPRFHRLRGTSSSPRPPAGGPQALAGRWSADVTICHRVAQPEDLVVHMIDTCPQCERAYGVAGFRRTQIWRTSRVPGRSHDRLLGVLLETRVRRRSPRSHEHATVVTMPSATSLIKPAGDVNFPPQFSGSRSGCETFDLGHCSPRTLAICDCGAWPAFSR